MRRPVLRFGGPIQARNVMCLLGLGAMLIIARIPLGFVSLLVLSLGVVVVQGVRPRAPWPRALRWLLLWCLAASFVSVFGFNPSQIPSTGNNFITMVAVSAVAVAIFRGGRVLDATDWVVDGLYMGLLLTWLISVGEAVTGHKMMSILYPGTVSATLVSGHRFWVSAFFPNYNDYSVAMVMLCTVVMAKLVFQPRVHPLRTLGRLFVLATAVFFIVVMQSRGSLIGLVAAAGLVLLLSVRVIDRSAVSIRAGLLSLAVMLCAGLFIFFSPYVQDKSTATRGTIITNVVHLLGDDPVNAVIGFASYPAYHEAASARFGGILMDPHNVLLEIVIWYGFPALLGYLVVWCTLVRRGLVRLEFPVTWRAVASLCVSALMPVLGVVPSSTLRYYVFWLWLVTASSYLSLWRRRQRALAGVAASPAA